MSYNFKKGDVIFPKENILAFDLDELLNKVKYNTTGMLDVYIPKNKENIKNFQKTFNKILNRESLLKNDRKYQIVYIEEDYMELKDLKTNIINGYDTIILEECVKV